MEIHSWRSGITASSDNWNGRFSGHWLTDDEADQKIIQCILEHL